MSNTITEIRNTLVGIKSKLDDKEEQINEMEDRGVEITEKKKEKYK